MSGTATPFRLCEDLVTRVNPAPHRVHDVVETAATAVCEALAKTETR
jgi:hypothetical protein